MFDKLFDLVIGFLKLFRCLIMINHYQRGVLLRWGKFKRELDPGLHFFWPLFIDEPLFDNVVLETMNVGPQSLTTKDGVPLVISTVVSFKIDNVKTFLLDVEGRNNVIEDATYGMTADFVMKRTWDELQNIDIGNELSKAVRRQAKQYGVGIVQVQLSDFVKCRSIRLMNQHGHSIPPVSH